MNKSTITIQFTSTSFLFLWRREAGYKMKLVRQVRADLESNGEWVQIYILIYIIPLQWLSYHHEVYWIFLKKGPPLICLIASTTTLPTFCLALYTLVIVFKNYLELQVKIISLLIIISLWISWMTFQSNFKIWELKVKSEKYCIISCGI